MVIVVMACGLGQDDHQANADLRGELRSDPAFNLIPADVRASLWTSEPIQNGTTGPENGMNGFGGVDPAPPADARTRLADLDTRLSAMGWKPSGGKCFQPDDPTTRVVGGIWTKRIHGRWAFFAAALVGQRWNYKMFIRAVSDQGGSTVTDLDQDVPGAIGCAQ
jgi:hypothetical protein